MGPAALKHLDELDTKFLMEQMHLVETRTIAADLELVCKEKEWRASGRVGGDWYLWRAKRYLLSSLRQRSEYKRAIKRRLKRERRRAGSQAVLS